MAKRLVLRILTDDSVDVELTLGHGSHCIFPSKSVRVDKIPRPSGEIPVDCGEWREESTRLGQSL